MIRCDAALEAFGYTGSVQTQSPNKRQTNTNARLFLCLAFYLEPTSQIPTRDLRGLEKLGVAASLTWPPPFRVLGRFPN
jgi:hypothetical protein